MFEIYTKTQLNVLNMLQAEQTVKLTFTDATETFNAAALRMEVKISTRTHIFAQDVEMTDSFAAQDEDVVMEDVWSTEVEGVAVVPAHEVVEGGVSVWFNYGTSKN